MFSFARALMNSHVWDMDGDRLGNFDVVSRPGLSQPKNMFQVCRHEFWIQHRRLTQDQTSTTSEGIWSLASISSSCQTRMRRMFHVKKHTPKHKIHGISQWFPQVLSEVVVLQDLDPCRLHHLVVFHNSSRLRSLPWLSVNRKSL